MKTIIEKTRTFRRFDQDRTIARATLEELLDLARIGGSARNAQPWQYAVVNDRGTCAHVFPYLGWAGYLSDWKGPAQGERPSAYILCLLNSQWLKGPQTEAHFDLGIASQNLLLGAMEKGIGGCRIGAFNPKLADIFDLPPHLSLSLVIALGYPKEQVMIEEVKTEDDIKYWRDDAGVHHVPKRRLADIIVEVAVTA